ncbi:MAG: hypothetical protein NPIRA06_34010 [Nitrospirales bacterium]|nr:MAG: hypothetical protein NPIRA06_34010 [Nitrospirales bacterium]
MTAPSHPHAITITPNPNRVKVTFNGTVIADTSRALILREGPVPPAQYLPREDVTMSCLLPTTHSTHCPFKGDASYFTVSLKGQTAENAVWTYEAPLASVADIRGYVAFYPEKMDAIEECPHAS